MGQAREVMDRLTEAAFKKDFDTVRALHAPDAVTVTPDAGELSGPDAAADYLRQVLHAFPDAEYESQFAHECGDTAIDEGYLIGTHTQPLSLPDGESLPASGRHLRMRTCDVVTVDHGVVTSHRFYFDQMDLLEQLGITP